jgi:FKBP-type peptidyl-prolyl cis-trans isomerase
MKLKSIIAIVAVGTLFASCGSKAEGDANLATVKDSTSYALGSLQTKGMMDQMKAMKIFKYIDAEWLLKGAEDRIDDKSLIDNDQARAVITYVMQGVRMDSLFTMAAATKGDVMVNKSDSLSYALGSQIIEGISQGATQLNVADKIDNLKVFDAIKDVVTDSSKMDAITARRLIDAVVQEANDKQAEVEGAKGSAFLEENKKREGVITTESGLQYEVLKEGVGASPNATDKVKVHYHGTLIDGTVFDSSVERGKPITFGLNQVIKGWTEGVQLMREGAKYKFYIPQELGYGGRAAGKIPPYSTLIFEVELLEVVKE